MKILKDTLRNTNAKNINKLLLFLKSISGKELKREYIRQNIFKTKWDIKQNSTIRRAHIQSAIYYLEYLLTDYNKKNIKNLISDIYLIVKLQINNNDKDLIISTNIQPSTINFKIAKDLFINHNIAKQEQNNYGTDLLATYGIRLSLEKRIRGLLGIDYAKNRNKNIGLGALIDIAKNLKSVEYSKEINWREIKLINNWLNHHIHRNIRPYPWLIFESIEILNPLIDPTEPIYKNESKIYSFYSGTYVLDEKVMEIEILHKLKEKYKELNTKWLNNDEKEIQQPTYCISNSK